MIKFPVGGIPNSNFKNKQYLGFYSRHKLEQEVSKIIQEVNVISREIYKYDHDKSTSGQSGQSEHRETNNVLPNEPN